MKNTYVMVHGAWVGGWCFDKIKTILEKEGHRVIAIDLPGHGGNPAPIEEQNIYTYAGYIVKVLKEQNEPVILLAHSMGGMSASHAASVVPEKIKKLVYLSAFLPRDGQSANGKENGIQFTDWAAMEDENRGITLTRNRKAMKLDPKRAIKLVYNDISREEALKYISHHEEEALVVPYQAVHITEQFYDIPKIYIRCLKDAILKPGLQDKMINETPCEAIYDLDTGHSPFVSKPSELARILLKL